MKTLIKTESERSIGYFVFVVLLPIVYELVDLCRRCGSVAICTNPDPAIFVIDLQDANKEL
jgi:hypothetical protein